MAAPRSCGRHWIMIFRKRRSSLIRTSRWMRSSTILRFFVSRLWQIHVFSEGNTRTTAVFLRNLLLNENHPLHNRTLHISGTFKETEKPDIEAVFQPKTASHILKLREAFPGQTIFGRSDVMKAIDLKASRASDLLKEMAEHGIIEPVTGHGKGKYRFRQQ